MKDVKQAKVYVGLADEFSRIAHVRFLNHLDKRYGTTTVQKKMLKHPLWGKIRSDLEIAKFLEEGK